MNSVLNIDNDKKLSIRKLSAIMFTDIVGYTAMIGKDENQAIKLVTNHKKVIREMVPNFDGDLIEFYGDGSLSIYPSATSAVECALAIQKEFNSNCEVPLRIGIHIGEILIEEGSIYGEGVNIASRIESLGEAGSILFSEEVYRKIHNNMKFKIKNLGEFELKNVSKPMLVYSLTDEELPAARLLNFNEVSFDKNNLASKRKDDIQKKESQFAISDYSIAVLPFVNMSSDPEQEFFCEGISEEIINNLVQIEELIVVGRTSSFSFKGKNEDLRSVGQSLRVSKIIEGSVRKYGNQIRVTAQLIEASTGYHIWSHNYDRKLDDIFKIQDEISSEIAAQLKVTLIHNQERSQTHNIEAYQLYYKGRSHYYKRGMSLFKALECFEKALDIDPTYALAYSGLADTYIMLSYHGYLSPFECWNNAIPASEKALYYGNNLGETHNTKALIALLHDRDFDTAEKEFREALEINPTHIQARVWYGLFYLTLSKDRFKEGKEQFIIAERNDPLSAYMFSCYAFALAADDEMEEAIKKAEYAVQLDSESWIARCSLSHCFLWAGKYEQALEHCEYSLNISNRHSWSLHLAALIYLKLGDKKAADKIFSEMKDRYRDHYLPPSSLGIVAAALNENDYAIEVITLGEKIIDPFLPFIANNLKDSAELRAIPEFNEIKKKLGFK